MGKEGIWIYNTEGEPQLVSYDELDEEAIAEITRPIGGFCYEASRFLHIPLPPVPYYIKDWLPKQGKAMLYASAKSGKSFLAVQIAHHIGIGEPLFGIPVQQGTVLYLQFELGERILQSRLMSTGKDYEGVFVGTNFSLKLDTPAGQQRVIQALDAINPDVLIIDPLYKTISGDENEAQDIRKIFDFLDNLIETFECSVLLIHHPGKDLTRGGRGSSVMEDWVDSYIEAKRTSQVGEPLKIKLTPKLLRHAELPPNPIEIILGSDFEFALVNQPPLLVDQILDCLRLTGEVTPKELLDSGVASNTTLYKTLGELARQGIIVKASRGRYVLPKEGV